MRRYSFLAGRPGGFMNWPGRMVTSDWKIRAVAIEMFRRWFGREPNFHWHSDGCMAEARDERGNYVQIQQFNAYEGFTQDLTRLALPAPAPNFRSKSAIENFPMLTISTSDSAEFSDLKGSRRSISDNNRCYLRFLREITAAEAVNQLVALGYEKSLAEEQIFIALGGDDVVEDVAQRIENIRASRQK